MTEKKKAGAFLTYKGKPLVRSGNTIYYGDMADDFVIIIKILSTKKVEDLEIAEKVTVQLLSTDPDIRPRDRIIKKSEKTGLYSAMDIAAVWLERALQK
jgi:arginyl-tRNA synthetase